MPSLPLILTGTVLFSAKYVAGRTCGEQKWERERGNRRQRAVLVGFLSLSLP